MHLLSKSTFMYGCQCPKRLFLHKKRPDLRNEQDEQQENIFATGISVGQLAQQLFPDGTDVTPPDSYSYHLSVEKTRDLITRGVPVIYEAAFMFEGVLCAIDMLVKGKDGWTAFEVKGTGSVKNQHITDGSLQYFVISNSGLPISDFSIIHLNTRYVRSGPLDISALFSINSIKEPVLEKQEFIRDKISELKLLLGQSNVPEISIGSHCFSPYGCDFTDHCWSYVPKENSVFDLPDRIAWRLFDEGIRHLDEIPEHFEMNSKADMQLEYHRTQTVHIDIEPIRDFLEPISYPLYFFDFETIMPAIPEFDGSRPYQQIPFQYSLHIQKTLDAELEHKAFLGDGITDPRRALLTSMLTDLGTTGTILCYNMTFEKSRIRELANSYPEFKNDLLALNERMVDLMKPFAQRWYYHPSFKGSYSIKVVLPVLISDLKYSDLVIQEGGTASMVYTQLKTMDEATASSYREHLLAYCKLDTYAMVRILDYLKEVIKKD